TETLDLVGVYGKWLDGTDCQARVTAARRLGELGRPEAVAALQKARKKRMPHGCGQDEIAEALEALERNRGGSRHGAGDARGLRALRRATERGRPGADLQLRVHLLRRLHGGDEGHLSELRRRAGAQAKAEEEERLRASGVPARRTSTRVSRYFMNRTR